MPHQFVRGGSVLPAPLVVSTSAVGRSSSGTSLSVPMPTHEPGDLLIAFVATRNSNGPAPSGWSQVAVTGTSEVIRIAVHTKIAGESELASVSFTASSSNKFEVAVLAVRGGVAAVSAVASGTTGTAHAAPNVVTTLANTLVLRAAAVLGGYSAATYSWAAVVTELTDLGYSDYLTNGVTLSTAAAVQESEGASGAVTATSSVSSDWATLTLAVQPAM